ncbi:hypothetical protein FACS1894172_05200 [Spirochaetia bacterium]|nr:hypothetical protein FACS1894164_05740 [Spirochaetia bacterium]GHU31014.1 hypothetical protein FACS1894172_05200 [Spirochaetia bacterium]
MVDVTESTIERPKKNSELLQWKEKAVHDKNAGDSQPKEYVDYCVAQDKRACTISTCIKRR